MSASTPKTEASYKITLTTGPLQDYPSKNKSFQAHSLKNDSSGTFFTRTIISEPYKNCKFWIILLKTSHFKKSHLKKYFQGHSLQKSNFRTILLETSHLRTIFLKASHFRNILHKNIISGPFFTRTVMSGPFFTKKSFCHFRNILPQIMFAI